MRICPHCGHESNAQGSLCQHCGKAFPLPGEARHGDTTVRYAGPTLGQRSEPRKATALDTLFAGKKMLLLGRSADCDVCLSHPMVSRHHGLLERLPDGRLQLTDLDSVNGISVNGARITAPVVLDDKAAVGIGPFLFTASASHLYTIDSSRSLRLEARRLEKVVVVKGGQKRKLLDDVNLVVEPGEFVSLLGPSGSGKSTLMDCLNGRRWATGGKVLANGEDFYRFFDNFRQSLGYVPQKDIVHTQLTVHRALYYTAKLRLPPDTSHNELMGRIEEVTQVMELGPHRDTLVANLSGGQIKRVSLGAELLARPCLLYIDEATSGLDAGTESRIMRLFRQLADEGKSLICITHNVDNVDRCHLALVLARGKVVYYGPPADAAGYFQVARISDIYDRLGQRDLLEWEQQFRASEFYQEFVIKRLAVADVPAPANGSAPARAMPHADAEATVRGSLPVIVEQVKAPRRVRSQRPPLWHQFRVLTTRYAELLLGDRRSLRLLVLQAPAVALILLVGFINKPFEGKLPLLRNLNDREKNVLLVLKGIEQDLAKDQPGQESPQGKGESEVTFTIDKLGQKKTVKGSEIRALLKKLEESPKDSPERQALEEIKIEVASGGARLPVNLKEVNNLQQLLRQSQLATKLLDTDREMPVVPERQMVDPRYTYMLLFMVVIIVLWFGCNNAAKEIVKEEAIYGRERAVNLGILPYLSSKFLLLSLITALQALLLMVLLYGALEALHQYDERFQVPPELYRLDYVSQFGVLALLSMTSVALGLLLSACVSSPDRANALLPYVLIPQIILGGGIMPVKDGPLYLLAVVLSPVYWAFRAVRVGTNDLPEYSGYRMDYPENPWLAAGALVLQLVALLVLTTWFLRRKDVRHA
jgi:ABC-type multidrug transport system ATPase subunit